MEIQVVGQINIELRSSRVRIVGPRQADLAAHVTKTVTGFIDDLTVDRLELKIFRVAARLRDKALDHSMKDLAFIVSLIDVFEEILDRKRRAPCVELEDEAAESRYALDTGIGGLGREFLLSLIHI